MKLLPRADNIHRTQKQAIAFHNKRKEVFASVPNIAKLVEQGEPEDIESLRKDCRGIHWLNTSSRIIYDRKNHSAKIIHNVGNTETEQIEIKVREIPNYADEPLSEVLSTEAGFDYLKALTLKKTKEEIINFFTKLSDKKENKLRFWTPSQNSRADRQICSVGLYFCDFGGFIVGGDVWVGDDSGFSRGVLIESAKQTKIFSNKAIFDIEEETITIPLQRKWLREINKHQKRGKVKINWKLSVKIK